MSGFSTESSLGSWLANALSCAAFVFLVFFFFFLSSLSSLQSFDDGAGLSLPEY